MSVPLQQQCRLGCTRAAPKVSISERHEGICTGCLGEEVDAMRRTQHSTDGHEPCVGLPEPDGRVVLRSSRLVRL